MQTVLPYRAGPTLAVRNEFGLYDNLLVSDVEGHRAIVRAHAAHGLAATSQSEGSAAIVEAADRAAALVDSDVEEVVRPSACIERVALAAAARVHAATATALAAAIASVEAGPAPRTPGMPTPADVLRALFPDLNVVAVREARRLAALRARLFHVRQQRDAWRSGTWGERRHHERVWHALVRARCRLARERRWSVLRAGVLVAHRDDAERLRAALRRHVPFAAVVQRLVARRVERAVFG